MSEEYVPKSKRLTETVDPGTGEHWKPEEHEAVMEMTNLLNPPVKCMEGIHKILESALYSVKVTTKDITLQRVFIQDFAAALNRRRLLGNDDVGAFCEWAYDYVRE